MSVKFPPKTASKAQMSSKSIQDTIPQLNSWEEDGSWCTSKKPKPITGDDTSTCSIQNSLLIKYILQGGDGVEAGN